MTIKEFIKKLEEFDQNLEVCIILDGCFTKIDKNTVYEVHKDKVIFIGQD